MTELKMNDVQLHLNLIRGAVMLKLSPQLLTPVGARQKPPPPFPSCTLRIAYFLHKLVLGGDAVPNEHHQGSIYVQRRHPQQAYRRIVNTKIRCRKESL